MFYTGSYKNCNTDDYKLVSISGDCGKKVNFKGQYCKDLAPKKYFWTIWHSNIGKISEEENTKYYIEEYYKQVLSKLNPSYINELFDKRILVCYEDNMEFCHRHIIAAWIELFLEIEIPEVKVEDSKLKMLKRPEYIKDILEKVIKENLDMKGYECIHAYKIYTDSEELDKRATALESNGEYKNVDELRLLAKKLRIQSKEIEREYLEKRLQYK